MQIIDLSHTMETGMPAWPGEESPVFNKIHTHDKDSVQVMKFSSLTHSGTHLDTPRHFLDKGKTIDQMPISQFYGKGMLIDCSRFGKGEKVPLGFIQKHEREIIESDFVLIYFGWDRFWGQQAYFDHFPVLEAEASQYLTQFNLKGIGMDIPSIDAIDSTDYHNHNNILGRGMIVIENLRNLNLLKDKTFQLAAFPLNIDEGDGSPVRAVAIFT